MRTRHHIVIVEDDPVTRAKLAAYFIAEGYQVSEAADGEQMRSIIEQRPADLLLIDVNLPGEDGLKLTREQRERSDAGIILVTGRTDTVDRIVGLEIGADDYLGKPFNPRELVARIRAVLRRQAEPQPQTTSSKRYRFEGFAVDPALRQVVSPDGAEIDLTGAEFDLLQVFLDRPGRVLSRDQLLDLTRGRDGEVFDRSVDVLMSRLRRKLTGAGAGQVFKTVRNGGYQLAVKVELEESLA